MVRMLNSLLVLPIIRLVEIIAQMHFCSKKMEQNIFAIIQVVILFLLMTTHKILVEHQTVS